jgi:hypothetical protein
MQIDSKTPQQILVFQQNGSGKNKIQAILDGARDEISLETVSIDDELPPIIDDSAAYLPNEIRADLVLDFLTHLDLSYDLARLCQRLDIPVVASGKKMRLDGVYTPPT